MSRLKGYIGDIIIATVFTSMSFHLLAARRESVTQRDRYMARITILESLVERLRQKEHIQDEEIDRSLALGQRANRGPSEGLTYGDGLVSWRDVIFGRSR